MGSENTVIHLLAGGAGGTAGAVLTCPLEVVKTRLQSSVASFNGVNHYGQLQNNLTNGINHVSNRVCVPVHNTYHSSQAYSTVSSTMVTQTEQKIAQSNSRMSAGLGECLRHIVKNEGVRGLFKGLGPNLVGVAPSRAIYFCAYDQAKRVCNTVFTPETPIVHICAAAFAGFTASTTTNPIWYIKTRLQLDQKRNGSLTVGNCVRSTYRETGIQGFYKGITASYYGISETVIHFVIYEAIKAKLRERKGGCVYEGERCTMDFIEFMGAGAVSKTIATCVAYPHEVARTRLRQPGNKYHGFWQTLGLVFREESVRGLYRGLGTQLVRQIPNTAIMMSTYEAVVYLCSRYVHNSEDLDENSGYH